MVHHILDGRLIALLAKLLYYTLRGLKTGLNMLYGIIPVNMLKFVIKDLKLGLHLLKGRAVEKDYFCPAVYVIVSV